MSFVGPVNRLDNDWIRPHDLELTRESNGSARPARVERVIHLGFEARVELELDDGDELWAQMTQEQCEELALEPGSRVHVRPRRGANVRHHLVVAAPNGQGLTPDASDQATARVTDTRISPSDAGSRRERACPAHGSRRRGAVRVIRSFGRRASVPAP